MPDEPARPSSCASFQVRTLKFIVRTTVIWWAAAVALGTLQATTTVDFGAETIVVTALGLTGSICYAIQRATVDSAGVLLQALKATRRQPSGPGLHLVDPQATQSSTPAQRRRAH